MRLWTLHPKYLDGKGLVALWREALLAKAVLAGETKGYRNHPQLDRFKVQPRPECWLNMYLVSIYDEAQRRGYKFNRGKIGLLPTDHPARKIDATTGQIEYEWHHLQNKLMERSPEVAVKWAHHRPHPHPLFKIVQGNVEDFERPKVGRRTSAPIYPENGTQAV